MRRTKWPSPHPDNVGIIGPKTELLAGVHEELVVQKEPNGTPQKTKHGDDELLSIFPAGLPEYKNEANFRFLYDWKQAKGRQRNLRSPSIKPEATNEDAEILAVFRRKSAVFAWDHLQSTKPRPTMEDITITNTVKDKKSKKLRSQSIAQLTQTHAQDIDMDLFSPPQRPADDSESSQFPTEKRRVPRPPWRDNSQLLYPLDLPVSKQSSEEYWTLDRRDDPCFQPLPLLDVCEVSMSNRSTKLYRRAKPITLDNNKFDSHDRKISIGRGRKCCAHPCFTVVPGRIRRTLPWAPCAPNPRTLLFCQHCGAAFCGKPERRQGRYVALVEFCGYAVIDEEGLISFHLNNPKAEAVPVETKPPKRVKCSCQRCRRKRRKYGDHYADCECNLCIRRALKCLNRNYYVWWDRYYRTKSKEEEGSDQDPTEPIETPETIQSVNEDEYTKQCNCPECRRRRRNPGDHFKDCECQFCENRKTKCMRFVLNADSTDEEQMPNIGSNTKSKADDSADSDNKTDKNLKNLATISKDSLERDRPSKMKIVKSVNWSEFKINMDIESSEDEEVKAAESDSPPEKVEMKPKLGTGTGILRQKKPDVDQPDQAPQIDQLLRSSISSAESNDSKSSIKIKKTENEDPVRKIL